MNSWFSYIYNIFRLRCVTETSSCLCLKGRTCWPSNPEIYCRHKAIDKRNWLIIQSWCFRKQNRCYNAIQYKWYKNYRPMVKSVIAPGLPYAENIVNSLDNLQLECIITPRIKVTFTNLFWCECLRFYGNGAMML